MVLDHSDALEGLVGSIYEAAALPLLWPETLQRLADSVGATGAVFVNQSPSGLDWIASPCIEEIVADYMVAGWMLEGSRTAPLLAELYPGFRAEIDYRTEDELNSLGVYREFLTPRNLIAGAGTAMQGVGHAGLHIAVEGFGSHERAARALPFLNRLRPHLGRALSLSAKLAHEQTQLIVAALQASSVAAAVVSETGRLRVANERFSRCVGAHIVDPLGRLRFLDRRANALLDQVLTCQRKPSIGSCSFALLNSDGRQPVAIHAIPIPRWKRDLFEGEGLLLLACDGSNHSIPQADLLRMLFDLTPAEATLARLLIEGSSVEQAAMQLKVKQGTARVHLKAIFAKTGVTRQSQLTQLLSGYAVGTSDMPAM